MASTEPGAQSPLPDELLSLSPTLRERANAAPPVRGTRPSAVDTLSVLQVEGSEARAAMILRALEAAGLTARSERVETEKQMRNALERQPWDAIIADFQLPTPTPRSTAEGSTAEGSTAEGFGAFAALDLLRRMRLDVPFLVVSGPVGDERVAQVMREGAHDWVGTEGLARLAPAVERAIRETAVRRERAFADEQLAQARKLDAVRQLAGGLGHDFNNLLQVVHGYGRLALDLIPPSGEARQHLEEVMRAVERARTLVLKLLTFSRRGGAHRDTIDLDALLADLSTMLRRLIGDRHELTAAGDGEAMTVRANPGEIEQVLVNLCTNAKEAMPSGGTIRVAVSRTRLDSEFCARKPWARPGDFALLSVTDEGAGMSPEVRSHLFEPFFSTKPHGKGAGLGLATVYGIVKQHDGFLDVHSDVGKGTTVSVYLPLVEPLVGQTAAPRSPASARAVPRAAPGSKETILLAEDDESVRGFTVRVLQGAGYRLHTAADGEEAVRLFETCGGAVDLAIIDVIMPRISGRALADRLRETRPRLPVLFSTGYAFPLFEEGFVPSPGMEVIRKPFTHVELLRRVRELIDTARVT